MARQEAEREDLMREATALVRRVELQVPGQADTVIAGFRANRNLSIYFGPDPAYHFDAAGGLRRAFVDGHLFRTQGATIAKLMRVRTESETQLRRIDLTSDELSEFRRALFECLRRLTGVLQQNEFTIVQQVPERGDIVPDLLSAIDHILQSKTWLAPRIKGKR